MRRLAFLLAVGVLAALVLTPGVAFANFAIHGGYTADTDACAGCHRAHTSVSSITWNDGPQGSGNQHSALLVSNATQMYEFCYACHGNDAQGADTNVEGGVYKGSVYGSHDATLNGGFTGDTNFMGKVKTSDHIIAGAWGAYGGGQFGQGLNGATGDVIGQQIGAGNTIPMTCASCHDPHGSSNYRLLVDKVNGNAVGGYDLSDNPTPYVISNEAGYPNGTTGDGTVGWKKHEPGQVQMAAYTPNYTTPDYAKAPSDDVVKGMSGWCSGCHTVYMQTGTPHGAASSYDAGDGWGQAERHRHPMNVSIASGNTALTVQIQAGSVPLPLAHTPGSANANVDTDWLDCMTCHVAHGTSTIMTGYANVADATNIEPNSGTVKNGTGGVQPTSDSALLRMDNRGVCEVCHNK